MRYLITLAIYLSVATLGWSCATSSPSDKLDATDDAAQDQLATDDPSSLTYREPDKAAECIRDAFEQQLASSLEGEIDVSTINVATARAMLEKHNRSLSGDAPIAVYSRELLRNENALVYFFKLPTGASAPIGALFLPFPNEDLGLASGRPDSPGLTITFADAKSEASEQVQRPALAEELLQMREKDQALRQKLAAQGVSEPDEELIDQIRRADARHFERLREIIEELGRWPGVELVGSAGADAAWMVAQHADQKPAFQAFFLEHLRTAVEKGRAPKRHLAYLVDRVHLRDGKPQVYGTQFDVIDGEIVLKPVENPEELDERRSEMDLPPIEEYKQQAREMYLQSVDGR